MSLQDTIAADVSAVFMNGDFDQAVVYTPQGGIAKTIRAQVSETTDEVFEEGSDTLDFDSREIEISSVDNTAGQMTVSELGRGGAGDTLTIPNSSDTWHVVKILENGRVSGSNMHRLLIRNKSIPMA